MSTSNDIKKLSNSLRTSKVKDPGSVLGEYVRKELIPALERMTDLNIGDVTFEGKLDLRVHFVGEDDETTEEVSISMYDDPTRQLDKLIRDAERFLL